MSEEETQTQVSAVAEHADEHVEEHALSTEETAFGEGQAEDAEQQDESDQVEAASKEGHTRK